MEPFDLLETLRWAPDEGYFLLERHLQRLRESASYFGYACPIDRIRDLLAGVAAGPAGSTLSDRPLRVRLLVDRQGESRVEHFPLQPTPEPLRVALAGGPIDPADPFLIHKTTSRRQVERHRSAAHDEVVLWNPSREITEAMTANIVVELDGRRVTPPVACGLLPGTMRADLLDRGEIALARVTVDQLLRAPRFWLINAVREWREAVLDRGTV